MCSMFVCRILLNCFLNSMSSQMICLPFQQISRNITTNEMANALRYNYLRGPGGRFRNPFDHGVRKNCSDFLIKGYNEDVERQEQTSELSDEIGLIQMTRNNSGIVMQNGEIHSHHANGNSHVCVDVESRNSRAYGHVHGQGHAHGNSLQCSQGNCNSSKNLSGSSSSKSDGAPLGLGLGLGLGRNNARHNSRSSVLAS